MSTGNKKPKRRGERWHCVVGEHLRKPFETGMLGAPCAAAPSALAQSFVDGLVAPQGKRLVWFNDCAHSPHFEAPDAFRRVVLEAFAG